MKDSVYIRTKRQFVKVFTEELDENLRKRILELRANKFSYGDSETEDDSGDPIYTRLEIKDMLREKTLFHSNNPYKRLKPEELFVESEEEIDNSHAKKLQNEVLEEYLDISPSCIGLFKLWNDFVREEKYRCQQKREVYLCRANYKKHLNRFLDQHKGVLRTHDLRYPFLMHLLTLQTYSFISPEDVLELIGSYDQM